MHRLQILVPVELFKRIKQISFDEDISIGEWIRRAIEKMLGEVE